MGCYQIPTRQGVAILCLRGGKLTPQDQKEMAVTLSMFEDDPQAARELASASQAEWPTKLFAATVKHMRAYAEKHGWAPGMKIAPYRRRLANGLTVEFYFNSASQEWTLAVAREDADPTNAECDRVKEAFGAPMLLTRTEPIRLHESLRIAKFFWKRDPSSRARESIAKAMAESDAGGKTR